MRMRCAARVLLLFTIPRLYMRTSGKLLDER